MLLDFAAPFNWLRAALRPQPPCPLAPPDCLCPLTHPDAPLPAWVERDPLVQQDRALIGDLPWHAFPERPTAPGLVPSPTRVRPSSPPISSNSTRTSVSWPTCALS